MTYLLNHNPSTKSTVGLVLETRKFPSHPNTNNFLCTISDPILTDCQLQCPILLEYLLWLSC